MEMLTHAKAQVSKRLEEYKAYGYEVDTIEVVECKGEEHKVERIVLKDVPNRSFIEVKRESKISFLISRRISRQNTRKDL
jgi:hypothetical protein